MAVGYVNTSLEGNLSLALHLPLFYFILANPFMWNNWGRLAKNAFIFASCLHYVLKWLKAQIVSVFHLSLLAPSKEAYTLILITARQEKAPTQKQQEQRGETLPGNFKAMHVLLLALQYDFCSAKGTNGRQLPICTSHINSHYANRFRRKPQATQLSSQRSVNRLLTMIYWAAGPERRTQGLTL